MTTTTTTTREQANRLAIALIDTINEEGSVPESYIGLAAEQAGGLSFTQATRIIDALVTAGLFCRNEMAFTIGKGPQFARISAALGSSRSQA